MRSRLRGPLSLITAFAVCLAAFAPGCGSSLPDAAMPQEMVGMDVVVGPRVALSGEGVHRNPDFGSAVIGAVESKLIGEGFDVVQPGAGSNPLRVELHANLSVSRSSVIMVNGKPLESEEARVQVRLLAQDGALLDSFDVAGDPTEPELARDVAAQLAERMKKSPRLQAMAKASPASPGSAVAVAKPEGDAPRQPAQAKALVPPRSGENWPDLARQVDGQRDGEKDAAVIVAIEEYAELTPIPGARANAEDWFQYLTKSRGVPRGSITMLLDQNARDKQIISATELAATKAKAGGRLWFVFIGHGAPNHEQKGMLVGYDAYQTAEGLADRSVKTDSVLFAMRTTPATPVVVLDACFSGRSSAGEALVPGMQPSAVVKNAPVGDALVLTAAQSNQFAGPLPGAERPAFSYLALGALRGWGDQDGNGQVTAAEVENYVGDTLRVLLAGDRQQTPTLEGERPGLVLSHAKEREPKTVQERLRSGAGR